MDFSKYKFRAHQCGLLLTGTIGLTEKQEAKYLLLSKKSKRTDLQEIDFKALKKKRDFPELSETVKTALKKIYRQEVYSRSTIMTNKYTQKGLQEEDAAIGLLQQFLLLDSKYTSFLKKNTKRFTNDYFTGEPDLLPDAFKIGYDTKCSWDLSTFPFPNEELERNYEAQNQVYMNLTGALGWRTAYCLINASPRAIMNEKTKWFYAYDADETNEEYQKKIKQVECNMIFDFKEFKKNHPNYDLEYTEDTWKFDMPIQKRVILKKSKVDTEFIKNLKMRLDLCRKYLQELSDKDF